MLILSAILSLGLTPAAPGPSRDSKSMKRILVFGDSLSEGFGLTPNQAYPVVLAAKLGAEGLHYVITNASQSGGTTDDGLHRLSPHLKPRIDIFILELGINDAFRGVPIEEIRNNLQEIINRVRRANPKVRIVICGMQLPNYTEDDYVSSFGRMYQEIAANNNAALVPYLLAGVGGDPALNQEDGIHPNAAGQKILAENVWRVLKPIAREVAGLSSREERGSSQSKSGPR